MQKQCTQQTCNAFRWYSKAYSTYSCPVLQCYNKKANYYILFIVFQILRKIHIFNSTLEQVKTAKVRILLLLLLDR